MIGPQNRVAGAHSLEVECASCTPSPAKPTSPTADAARERTQDAIDTLFAIMKDPKAPAAARISAAQAILDRGYGKPAQAIEVDAGPDLTHVSDEDLRTLERILRPPDYPPPPLLTGRGVSPTEENS